MILQDWLYLLFIILLIIVSAFFSGSETAITAVSKARILSKIKQGIKKANFVENLINKKEDLITSLLLANNLVNVLSSALATAFLYKVFGNSGIIYATLIMTIIIVIFAEVLPKTYAINRPTRTALAIGKILSLLVFILSPLVKLINLFVNFFLKNFIKKNLKFMNKQIEEELKGTIDLYGTSDSDTKQEKVMLHNVLTLSDTSVDEIMTHRSNIFSIDLNMGIEEITKKISNSKFTRIPVWKNTPENIIGILDSRSFISDKFSNKSINKEIITSLLKKPWFIPESTDLLDQLFSFKNKKEHLALVIDEYGELLGMLTLEDIIEEIVGDIVDEIDSPTSNIIELKDGSIDVEGLVNIRDLNKKFSWNLLDDEVSTIGGFVINLTKRIPLYGEIINFENYTFKILSHSRKKIIRLNIKKTNN
tara:strand:- start:644 stop:1906 length:1263 start_codon:yes stop_codon:yes gene_type:complete